MQKISWTDRIADGEVLERVLEKVEITTAGKYKEKTK
jgi:hypothetical protein